MMRDLEYERAVALYCADYAYSLWGEDCETVRISRADGIEPQYRQDLVDMEKANKVHRKAHEDACAKAAAARAGVKVAVPPPKRERGPNKPNLATALRHAAKNSLEMTRTPDGTMKFRPVTANKNDPAVNPWDTVLHVKD
jgi:hypothetical protein